MNSLKEIALLATPGPWWIDSHGSTMVSHSPEASLETIFVTDCDRMGKAVRHKSGNLSHWRNDYDASYIASANPSVVLELIAQRDELLAALKSAQATLAHCKADIGYRHRQTQTAIDINAVIAKCEKQ